MLFYDPSFNMLLILRSAQKVVLVVFVMMKVMLEFMTDNVVYRAVPSKWHWQLFYPRVCRVPPSLREPDYSFVPNLHKCGIDNNPILDLVLIYSRYGW